MNQNTDILCQAEAYVRENVDLNQPVSVQQLAAQLQVRFGHEFRVVLNDPKNMEEYRDHWEMDVYFQEAEGSAPGALKGTFVIGLPSSCKLV